MRVSIIQAFHTAFVFTQQDIGEEVNFDEHGD